ncbi:MAG: glycoside hydrolase family 43 protein [Treponema sp.]|nr:glycoside hydrolase family 43 protein [Treponema sp.]
MCAKIINPILAGFYPDPSVCVADGWFYIVNSSFSYVPGLPIFRSKDCVKWEQIGNIIDRPSQLDFTGAGVSRGLFAPTIRYNQGRFYCICTQVDKIGNFFVYADKPEGPWSDPVVIEGAEGIDPSLFFDDDGTVWYVGTRPAPEGVKYNGNWEIWIQKIDITTGKLLGESKGIWRGALRDCVWPEGPHIYKINGMYYLLHAEGGTGPEHAVCVARCETIDGQWGGKKANPILTHRHLGMGAGVVYVGHADLFCDNNGRWWMVCLASRPYGDKEHRYCNMGRETFLVPVKWEDDWPLVSWETGLVEQAYDLFGHVVKRTNDDVEAAAFPVIDDFNTPELDMYWLSLRNRNPEQVTCSEKPGVLRLYGAGPITEPGETSFVARRQTGFSYEACGKANFHFANDGDCAGIVCFQNEKFNYRLQVKLQGKVVLVQLIQACGGDDIVLKEEVITGGSKDIHMVMRVVAEKQNLHFQYGFDERNMNLFAEHIDGSFLSVERAGGFVGTIIGMFATAANYTEGSIQKDFYVDFDWFKYENTARSWVDKA